MKKYKLGMIIAAGGSGSRFSKKINKLLVDYRGKPLFVHSLETFIHEVDNNNLAIAAPADLLGVMQEIAGKYLPEATLRWTVGGATRTASVCNALALLDDDLDLVAIHDAARPWATGNLLAELASAALEYGGAVPAVTPVDTIKELDGNGLMKRNLIRQDLAMVSTPQVFDYKEYLRAVTALDPAVRSGAESDPELTDDAAVFFKNGGKVKAVFCPDAGNFKITLPGDLEL